MSREPAQRALQEALRLLAGRDYTRAALRRKLLARGCSREAADAAVDRCEQLGYVNDRAFGETRARSLLERRPSGRRALLVDLQRQGIAPTMSEQIADEALAEAGGDARVIAAALERWIARHGDPADWRAARRCADHLERRGFATAAVRAAMQPWLDELSF